ncbi:hypothetical protein HMPREF1211_05846 [Streptomyces sp. HGB0020]|nr:hypothetical protein HMPREF1211_05846 [Streptomyces sp. HGB0020]
MHIIHTGTKKQPPTRPRTPRGPWAALCAATAALLFPTATTAPTLNQANAAPPHHTTTDEPQAYFPSDTGRRRTVGS